MKLANWLRRSGWSVEEDRDVDPLFAGGRDLYCLSAVFSWRLPLWGTTWCPTREIGGSHW